MLSNTKMVFLAAVLGSLAPILLRWRSQEAVVVPGETWGRLVLEHHSVCVVRWSRGCLHLEGENDATRILHRTCPTVPDLGTSYRRSKCDQSQASVATNTCSPGVPHRVSRQSGGALCDRGRRSIAPCKDRYGQRPRTRRSEPCVRCRSRSHTLLLRRTGKVSAVCVGPRLQG